MLSGVQIGIIIALPVAGLISAAALGWELVYYALAMMGLAMAVISGTLTASSPEDHQAVGDTEKEFIRKNLEYYRKVDTLFNRSLVPYPVLCNLLSLSEVTVKQDQNKV